MANDPLTPGSIDWSDLTYYHLEEGEMFWFSKNPNTNINPAHRKLTDTKALNLKLQQEIDVPSNLKIWLKEY